MKCHQCKQNTKHPINLLKNGKPLSTNFCSYECYKKFWSDSTNFEPLPLYEG